MKLSHYRKNRRFLSQVTTAQLLRIIDVIRSTEPEAAARLECLLVADTDRVSSYRGGEETAADEGGKRKRVADLLPTVCKLRPSNAVSPECLEAGKIICDLIKKQAEHSPNMKFSWSSDCLTPFYREQLFD